MTPCAWRPALGPCVFHTLDVAASKVCSTTVLFSNATCKQRQGTRQTRLNLKNLLLCYSVHDKDAQKYKFRKLSSVFYFSLLYSQTESYMSVFIANTDLLLDGCGTGTMVNHIEQWSMVFIFDHKERLYPLNIDLLSPHFANAKAIKQSTHSQHRSIATFQIQWNIFYTGCTISHLIRSKCSFKVFDMAQICSFPHRCNCCQINSDHMDLIVSFLYRQSKYSPHL